MFLLIVSLCVCVLCHPGAGLVNMMPSVSHGPQRRDPIKFHAGISHMNRMCQTKSLAPFFPALGGHQFSSTPAMASGLISVTSEVAEFQYLGVVSLRVRDWARKLTTYATIWTLNSLMHRPNSLSSLVCRESSTSPSLQTTYSSP